MSSAHSYPKHSSLVTEEVEHYLMLLRDLAWRTIEGAEDPAGLKQRFWQLLRQGYPRELQLPYAYLALLAYLLQVEPLPIEPEQLLNGAACLDTAGLTSGNQIPQPSLVAELGALWIILGVRQKNEALVYAGLKVAYWQAHLLDHRGLLHLSLWIPGTSYHLGSLAAFNYLLLTLAYRVTSGQGFYQAAQIQRIYGWDPTSLAGKLLTLIPEKLSPPVLLPHRPPAEEVTLGMLKFTGREWSIACSLSGWNSGCFSYHKSLTALINAGPQAGPLDGLERFGIARECSSFREVLWEKTLHHFRLKGWTRIFASSAWMQMDVHYQAQKVMLSCLLQEGKFSERISFVFYATCDQLSIAGRTTLQPGVLDRYQGKALPLQIETNVEIIYIEPMEAEEMQVIPLNGGHHFFSAQFLIAYSFNQEKDLLQLAIR